MAYVYTAWPTTANVITYASVIAPALASRFAAVDTATLTAMINSSQAQIQQKTRRQFITTSEARLYDGSGTGQQIIDDYVSIDLDSSNNTKVYIYSVPGQTTGFLQLAYVQPVTEPGMASNMLQIIQGPILNSTFYWTQFPQGRSNVQVYATWGYAATIPYDVFELVMADVADKLIGGVQVSEVGLVLGTKDGDGDYRFGNTPWWESSGWKDRAKSIIGNYKPGVISTLARRYIPQY